MSKKLILTLLIPALVFACFVVFAMATPRTVEQLVADGKDSEELISDAGVTSTVTELNILNTGTNAVSDTFYHTIYVTVPIDFAVQSLTAGRMAWAKPNDVSAKVIGATLCIDSTAIVANGTGQMFLYLWRYDAPADTASGVPLDSLITGNKIQLDSTLVVAGGNWTDLTLKSTSVTLSDSNAIEVWLVTSNNVITSQAHGSLTFELYVAPE